MKRLAPLDDWPIWARHSIDSLWSFPDGTACNGCSYGESCVPVIESFTGWFFTFVQ
jgi:hypothetical protein